MTGLRLMNELMDPATRERVLSEHANFRKRRERDDDGEDCGEAACDALAEGARRFADSEVGYLDRKVRLVPDLREVWSYINPYMLYGRHMGYRGDFEKYLAARETKAVELFNGMEEVKTRPRLL